jgi:integral membrane sensor domain MASE1
MGAVMLVLAAGLAWWGYDESGSLGNRLSSTLTGDMNDTVIILYIGAAICAVVGIVLVTGKHRG